MMQDSALAPAFSSDLACCRTPNNISKIYRPYDRFRAGRGMSKNNPQVAGYLTAKPRKKSEMSRPDERHSGRRMTRTYSPAESSISTMSRPDGRFRAGRAMSIFLKGFTGFFEMGVGGRRDAVRQRKEAPLPARACRICPLF